MSTRYRAKPRHITAYCWTNGVIGFTTLRRPLVPKGALPIISGPPRRTRDLVTATARHAYDGKTLLVPGIPEADMMKWDKLRKLEEHTAWLLKRPGFYEAIRKEVAA